MWRIADRSRLGLSVVIFIVSAACLSVAVSFIVNLVMLPGTLIIREHPTTERYVMVAYLMIAGLGFLFYRLWRKKRASG